MIDINMEEIYAQLKNTNKYLGFKEQALYNFVSFVRPDMTIQDTMNSVYNFTMEDDKPLIAVSKPHWIMDIFALKMASIHYGCHIPELDEQVLTILNENLLTQYKEYYNLFDYHRLRCDMLSILQNDPLLFDRVSEKAMDQDRINNNSFLDFQNNIHSLLIGFLKNENIISETLENFFEIYLIKTDHIIKKGIPYKILVYYALKICCNYMRYQSPMINQLVVPLALEGLLAKYKESFSEWDYGQLCVVEKPLL